MIFNQRRLDSAFHGMAPDFGGDLAMPGQPPETFTWGSGGKRLTPEDIALQRQLAQEQMQAGADYSPVGHWSQGLARVAQGLMGSLGQRRADKAADANAAQSDAVLQALMGAGGAAPGNDAIVSALANPYLSGDVKGFAGKLWDRANPKPRAPFEFEQLLTEGGFTRGTPAYQAKVQSMIENRIDPYTTISTPDFFFNGRQSQVGAALGEGGGQQVSPSSGAPPAPSASAAPGGGYMTVDQMRSMAGGTDFLGWQQRFGTPVLVTSPEEMAHVPVGTMVVSPDGRRGVKK